MGKLEVIKKVPFFGSASYKLYMNVQQLVRQIENKQRVKNFSCASGKRIFYLDIPVHPNLGDLAQYMCIKKWIADNYPDRACIEIDGLILSDLKCGFIDKLKKIITDDDIIFFQSGYCTQDLGGYHDLVHRIIVENFPNTPIVMLPQTVYYQHPENAKRTADVYSKHNKIFFMARDFTSAELAKELFMNLDVQTYPDIVTTLIGTHKTANCKRNGVALCIRNDSEKYYSDQEIAELHKKLEAITDVFMCDTTIGSKFSDIKPYIEQRIFDMINQFGSAKVIITDRYHGTIFSLIAGTPVIVIKTTDHKVKTGVEWFKGVYDDYVYYAESLEEAYDKAQVFLNTDLKYQLEPYFKKRYYDGLKDKINAFISN